MRIDEVIRSIDQVADRWVRLEEVRRVPKGLDLSFGVHKGRRGKRIDSLRISCVEVHEANITVNDYGGLALYSSTHPAARERVARPAEVRWSSASDEILPTAALYKAHTDSVDDWIPFERYSKIQAIAGKKLACRGPDFLMRAYAKALRSLGKQPQVILKPRSRKVTRPRVLHFGDSYVVANAFLAQKPSTAL